MEMTRRNIFKICQFFSLVKVLERSRPSSHLTSVFLRWQRTRRMKTISQPSYGSQVFRVFVILLDLLTNSFHINVYRTRTYSPRTALYHLYKMGTAESTSRISDQVFQQAKFRQ